MQPSTRRPAYATGAFVLLMLVAIPAIVHFAASDDVATAGDDSIAYLMLARHILDAADPVNREWVGYQAHFPPLFPLLLASTGGAFNLATAHAVVAAFAVLSLGLLYRYASRVLEGNAAGLLVVALFLLTPTAWISIRGILSESAYLFCSLLALLYHEARLRDREAGTGQWLLFGMMLGAAAMMRSAGVLLLLAYVAHFAALAAQGRAPRVSRALLPLLPVAAMAALWLLWRPRPEGFSYGSVPEVVNQLLIADPLRFLASCAQVTFGGWLRSFTADSDVHWLPKAAFALVGAAGIAGAVLRARRHHLDGWYVLASLPVIFLWFFSEDNTRRLLYPLVPLAILHAAVFVAFACGRMASRRRARILAAAAVVLPALLCLPAWLVVQGKSRDGEEIHAGSGFRYSEITDYYTRLPVAQARAAAAKEAAVLGALESLRVVTPPGSRVMWARPDYVAVLGGRQGVAWYYRWSRKDFLRGLQQADFLVISTILKLDMDGARVDEAIRFDWALGVAEVVFAEPDAARTGYDAAVLKIDQPRVARLLEATP